MIVGPPRARWSRPLLVVALGVGLAVAPFLPVYPARVMTRSFVIGGAGDEISYSYELGSIPAYFEHLHYARHEDYVMLIMALDLLLALLVATAIAALVFLVGRRLIRNAKA